MGLLKLTEETTPATPAANSAVIYPTTAATARLAMIDDAATVSIMVSEASTDQGSSRLQNKDLDAATTKIVDGTDTTKKIGWQTSGATASTTLTIIEAQSTSQSLNVPNITASSILITDTLAQNITGVKTMTNMTTLANTTTVPSMTMSSGAGTFVTSPLAGQWEYSGTAFYSTPVASARGVSPSTMFSIVPAGDFNLATTAGVQAAFPSTGDVWTLAASTTYLFEGMYFITKTTTSVTVALAFAASSAPTACNYFVSAFNAAADTTTATVAMTYVDTVATTVINATSTAATAIQFKGLLRTNGATTITPQVNWSANTTVPVMKANSYITFTPLGSSTLNTIGNVG